MALLHGVESDMLFQRGCMGRQKQEKQSSFLGLRHRQGRQCFPRPTVWETFSKCMGEPRHAKRYCSGFKEKNVILLEITGLKRYCPLPQKQFTCYCSIWEMAILEQGKMEK